MKILVIETDPLVPIGSLGPALVAAGFELLHWRTPDAPPPTSLDGIAGVIALGGPANPDDDDRYPWLTDERALLVAAVRKGLPTLGVCLGAQLLAQALGASVRPLSQPEIGWFELNVISSPDDALGAQLPERLDVFSWHSYSFDLPLGARALAQNGCGTQAFSWGGTAWGFQFHPEADERIIADWIARYESTLQDGGLDPQHMIDETRRRAPSYRLHSAALAGAFGAVLHRADERAIR